MDIPIPFPLPNPDACQTADSGIQCPLKKGDMLHYKNTLVVLKSYPKVLRSDSLFIKTYKQVINQLFLNC